MTEWFDVNLIPMPKDRPFISMWKGTRCITEYDDVSNKWYFSGLPAQYDIFHIPDESDRIGKFYYWCELPEFPKGW